MKISFHGADQGVIGSCHQIECTGKRILIDCGLCQDGRELDEENAEPFGFEPASIDIVLLIRAHLDHCGRLTLLVKRGFRGEIIATAATRELARLVMLDAAHLPGLLWTCRRRAHRAPSWSTVNPKRCRTSPTVCATPGWKCRRLTRNLSCDGSGHQATSGGETWRTM